MMDSMIFPEPPQIYLDEQLADLARRTAWRPGEDTEDAAADLLTELRVAIRTVLAKHISA